MRLKDQQGQVLGSPLASRSPGIAGTVVHPAQLLSHRTFYHPLWAQRPPALPPKQRRMSVFFSSPLQHPLDRAWALNSRLATERARSSGAGSSQGSALPHSCPSGRLLLSAREDCPLSVPVSVVGSYLREVSGSGETLDLHQGQFCTLMGRNSWPIGFFFVVLECPLINSCSDRLGGFFFEILNESADICMLYSDMLLLISILGASSRTEWFLSDLHFLHFTISSPSLLPHLRGTDVDSWVSPPRQHFVSPHASALQALPLLKH